jgi:hypothetical protein
MFAFIKEDNYIERTLMNNDIKPKQQGTMLVLAAR